MRDMEEIYTEYEFGQELMIKYRDIYENAMLNSSFVANLPDMGTILNELYSNIWENTALTDTEKERKNNELAGYYEAFKKDP